MRDYVTLSEHGQSGQLTKWIKEVLYGTDKIPGMIQGVCAGCGSWEVYQRQVGAIAAYNAVLQKMTELATRHVEDAEEQAVFTRSGVN